VYVARPGEVIQGPDRGRPHVASHLAAHPANRGQPHAACRA
jgi:hypothetical protein